MVWSNLHARREGGYPPVLLFAESLRATVFLQFLLFFRSESPSG